MHDKAAKLKFINLIYIQVTYKTIYHTFGYYLTVDVK